MPDSRRALYRVVYPLAERPTFEMGRFLFEVVDVSEKGLRYVIGGRRAPDLGAAIEGKIQFRRGDEIAVTGEVIRSRDGVVVISLDPALPFAEILAEQRYLRSKGYTLKQD